MKWEDVFKEIKTKDYSRRLNDFLNEEYASHVIYPKREDMFNAFKMTPLEEVKVVIFGQDPYHEPNQAMGLAFSVPDTTPIPPSLVNIYKEIENEFGKKFVNRGGDLTYLTRQGVMLLNPILTVREHMPLSHNIPEYKQFTKDIISILNDLDQPIVFLLWGGNAKKLGENLSNPKHLVLKATHPSPLGANKGGWFGCNHFIKTNEFLRKNGLKEINWLK